MSKDNYIMVDYYLCGVYQGKIKVTRDSVMGQVAQGNQRAALGGLWDMVDEINQIPNVKATVEVKNDEH